MKNLLPLFCLLLPLSLIAQKTDQEAMKLKGKVKQYEISTYQTAAREGKVKLTSMTTHQILDFDSLGYISQTELTHPRYSSNVYITKYIYDEKKRVVKHENYKNDVLGECDSLIYNKDNKVEKT
jgi:hypothetical protein